MQYRKFGKSDWQASALGFGCMRLPKTGEGSAPIDEKRASQMIYDAIEKGVNYIDTAYMYHSGQSEVFLGKTLQGGWRQKIHLASKLPIGKLETPADIDRIFDEQLGKLQTDYVDNYMMHGINKDSFQRAQELGVIEWAEKQLSRGRIRQFGFSFHDKFDVFKSIIDAYEHWSFCQIQYNYMDVENQAGTTGLKYAAEKGLAVVIMEPLLGGKLAKAPQSVQALWDSAPVKRSPADWALQWLWSQPEVTVLLSGMSTEEQLAQNLKAASVSQIGMFSADEYALVDKVRAAYKELCPVSCTACGYCQPCPNNINIPEIFQLFNTGRMYGVVEEVRFWYNNMPAEKRANMCAECGQCEAACPQSISICDWLKMADQVLGQGKTYEEVINF